MQCLLLCEISEIWGEEKSTTYRANCQVKRLDCPTHRIPHLIFQLPRACYVYIVVYSYAYSMRIHGCRSRITSISNIFFMRPRTPHVYVECKRLNNRSKRYKSNAVSRGMELVGGAKRQCLLCIVRAECIVCTTDWCIDKEIERGKEKEWAPRSRGTMAY